MRRVNFLMFWFYVRVAFRSLKNPSLGHLLLSDHLVMNKMRDIDTVRKSAIDKISAAYDDFNETAEYKMIVEVRS